MAKAPAKKRKRTSAAANATAPSSLLNSALPALTVRHYCQGIGDSHLLTFRKSDGSMFRMLIDCGVHSSITGGGDLIRDIAADIKKETGGKIDVLVVTHEHWDHVSGFTSAAEIFDKNKFAVDEVWMAWSENPKDPDAIAFDRFKTQALAALKDASAKLDAVKGLDSYVGGLRDSLNSVLGFQFGAAGEKVRAARDAAAALSKRQPPVYMGPETAPFSIPGLPNIRIYVLGPPRSRDALKLETKASEQYPLAADRAPQFLKPLRAALDANNADSAAYPADDACPFDPHIGTPLSDILAGSVDGETSDFVRRHYSESLPTTSAKPRIDDETVRDQSWRRIDADWLGIAADLAMQLDRGVNNTSLVLAFEMIDSGRVFLFPGDAQIGSWLSWQDLNWKIGDATVTASDLLARTVFYKVGHHGSQNATAQAKGMELMTSPDLSAFIPTNQADAKKVGWGEMPFHGILDALEKKTGGRTVRADDSWLGSGALPEALERPSGSLRAIRSNSKLWVEFDLA
ncbi:MBL fold metallo-hydrolase [Rhizobium sp. C4]|uniref:MBL fold metallo-hydrolase n=1 Tax=Rhizobium sp. C4 TaxID=1349800 RepID=UPI001E44C87A|nr:MBL fold metallo-hydrolase [Rhizobium sp. C4]MCD2175049.1 MBL fold metallo-hydrolase [Rhizobium sp. C4]